MSAPGAACIQRVHLRNCSLCHKMLRRHRQLYEPHHGESSVSVCHELVRELCYGIFAL